jgi:ankyrin repeat protein
MDAKDMAKAIQNGELEALQKAMDARPELANVRDENGVSLLLQAAYHRKWEVADLVLSYKETLDIFEAAAFNHSERIKQLVEDEPHSMGAWSPDGFTALHLAAFFGRLDAVETLVANGAEVSVPSRNPMAVTPLGSAAAGSHHEIVEVLLTHGAEVDAQQTGGYTALHTAAHSGDQDLVKKLLSHGADRSLRTDEGKNAADMARERNFYDIERLLESQPTEG